MASASMRVQSGVCSGGAANGAEAKVNSADANATAKQTRMDTSDPPQDGSGQGATRAFAVSSNERHGIAHRLMEGGNESARRKRSRRGRSRSRDRPGARSAAGRTPKGAPTFPRV